MIIAGGCHSVRNQKEVFPIYYVGIDIAKLNHFASVVSADGEVLIKPFKFTNDNDGFCKLLSVLASYERGSLIIGLESTAHYADNLVEFPATDCLTKLLLLHFPKNLCDHFCIGPQRMRW